MTQAIRRLPPSVLCSALACLVGCSPPPPRSYDFFMEDSIARDGVLARCNQNPDAALHDIECANARRAATALLLREEQARREQLERESEAKLEALRREFEAARHAAREAELAAASAARAEYEARWVEPTGSANPAIAPASLDAASGAAGQASPAASENAAFDPAPSSGAAYPSPPAGTAGPASAVTQ